MCHKNLWQKQTYFDTEPQQNFHQSIVHLSDKFVIQDLSGQVYILGCTVRE